MRALGIDIGGTSVKAVVVGDDGAVEWTGRSAAYARPDSAGIARAIAESMAGRGIEFSAVGLCCPGLLDRAKRVITLAVNVPGIVGVPLDLLVAQALGSQLPAAEILSDAAATAYDIYESRGLAGRLLCLSIGTGVGASVVDGRGRFLHVSGETPGHFGQFDVSLDENPPIGPDGGAGSLEAYVGAGAAVDWESMDVGAPAVRALVRAIRIAHAIYRPQHVALAGGVGIRLGRLVPGIKSAVDAKLTRVARAGWTLFAGESDFHAACGAARYAMGAS